MKKIKEYLNKNVPISVNLNMTAILLVIVIILSCISFHNGSSHKMNVLVNRQAHTAMERLKKNNVDLTSEIKRLSEQKSELSDDLSSKEDIYKAFIEYDNSKIKYNNELSSLNSDIKILTNTVQEKQNELNNKIAAKQEEERRIAAEKEAEQQRIAAEKEAEQQRIAEEKSHKEVYASDSEDEMVWIGETGSKYHYKDCRTLKGNKYQISLKKAKAQGRTACKVCH